MSRYGALWITILLSALIFIPAHAEQEQDEIKRLRDAGEILPLQAIVEKLSERQLGARILEADLVLEGDRYVYALKVLGADGTVRESRYDARTGEYLPTDGE